MHKRGKGHRTAALSSPLFLPAWLVAHRFPSSTIEVGCVVRFHNAARHHHRSSSTGFFGCRAGVLGTRGADVPDLLPFGFGSEMAILPCPGEAQPSCTGPRLASMFPTPSSSARTCSTIQRSRMPSIPRWHSTHRPCSPTPEGDRAGSGPGETSCRYPQEVPWGASVAVGTGAGAIASPGLCLGQIRKALASSINRHDEISSAVF